MTLSALGRPSEAPTVGTALHKVMELIDLDDPKK